MVATERLGKATLQNTEGRALQATFTQLSMIYIIHESTRSVGQTWDKYNRKSTCCLLLAHQLLLRRARVTKWPMFTNTTQSLPVESCTNSARKKDDPLICNNYRPISLLSRVSKSVKSCYLITSCSFHIEIPQWNQLITPTL